MMIIVICRRKLFVNKGKSNFEWQEATKGESLLPVQDKRRYELGTVTKEKHGCGVL
jgi:uncharacterized protein (DUF2249 family)